MITKHTYIQDKNNNQFCFNLYIKLQKEKRQLVFHSCFLLSYIGYTEDFTVSKDPDFQFNLFYKNADEPNKIRLYHKKVENKENWMKHYFVGKDLRNRIPTWGDLESRVGDNLFEILNFNIELCNDIDFNRFSEQLLSIEDISWIKDCLHSNKDDQLEYLLFRSTLNSQLPIENINNPISLDVYKILLNEWYDKDYFNEGNVDKIDLPDSSNNVMNTYYWDKNNFSLLRIQQQTTTNNKVVDFLKKKGYQVKTNTNNQIIKIGTQLSLNGF